MTSIKAALEAVDRHLELSGRRTLVGLLRPGLRRAQVLEHFAARGLTPPDGVLALYEWHNGTNATTGALLGDLWLFPGFYFLSIEDAFRNYDAFLSSDRWDYSWVPIFADGAGDFYAIECDSSEVGYGMIHRFRSDESEHPVEYKSLANMLTTIATAYDEGIFFMDGDGYLELDDSLFADLAARLNEGVSWWSP